MRVAAVRPPLETVRDFIDAFVAAWPTGDADAVAAFFSEDAVYHNGPLEPVRGRGAIRDAVASFMMMGGQVGVDLVNVLVDGQVVMTERIDYFTMGDRRIALPLMGIFHVRDDRITAWRDYFDLAQFTAQMSGAD